MANKYYSRLNKAISNQTNYLHTHCILMRLLAQSSASVALPPREFLSPRETFRFMQGVSRESESHLARFRLCAPGVVSFCHFPSGGFGSLCDLSRPRFPRRDTLYNRASLLPSVLAIADCGMGIFSEKFVVTVEPPSGRICQVG